MKRLALLISGGGTTATAILNACSSGKLKGYIKPALVISSNSNAKGLQRTRETGEILHEDQVVINPKNFTSPEAFGEAILKECASRNIDIIGQYGWMVRTPINVIQAYSSQMINQHPGPIDPGYDDFGGDYMHGRRVHFTRLFFVRETKRDFWTEATAQRVHPKWDRGQILRTECVETLPKDDVETLKARVLEAEYRVQIMTLLDFSMGMARDRPRKERLIQGENDRMILLEGKRIARLMYPIG